MTRANLGEFEQQVLLAGLQIEGDVYAVPIAEEIERATGRSVSHAAVFIAMRRLERRGLVTSTMGEPTGKPGGKPRRLYRVTALAIERLAESRRAYDALWSGLNLDRLRRERSS